jgi:hypothetical protein
MIKKYEKFAEADTFVKRNNEDGTHSFVDESSLEVQDWIAEGNVLISKEQESLNSNPIPNN